MKINVGSQNKGKVAAVRDTVALYPNLFPDAEVTGVDVQVELYGHPKNIEETVAGAIERARQAFVDCAYSVGLEGGLIEVPHTVSGYMEVGACAIYDGKRFVLGLSPAFEWPKRVNDMILQGEGDASVAFKKLGFTEHEKIGAVAGGIIGFLTDGRMPREDFSKYSIMMAIVQLEKAALYS
jgi:inosine/xanthosine triphosphatase